MKLAILSRDATLYSTRRLIQAARERNFPVRVLDPLRCTLNIAPGHVGLHHKGRALEPFDAVIPRIGTSITHYGTAVLRQFELMGSYTPNPADAFGLARDKLRCQQVLTSLGIRMPTTVYGDSPEDTAHLLKQLGEPPHVFKLNQGAQGAGVMLAETRAASRSAMDALRSLKADFIAQPFIAEAQGRDVRCFVIGQRVVAAMQRQASANDFRANLHAGGVAVPVKITAEERAIALQAARAVGLGIAGVDLIRSASGPLLLEVNASPGLEGIEQTSGVDIAGRIVEYVARHAMNRSRR